MPADPSGHARAASGPPPRSSILIRLPNWVGDLMMAVRAVHALRAVRPDARLVGMARPGHLELADRIGAFDAVVEAPSGGGMNGVASVWSAVHRLRRETIDAAVVLAPSFEAALTARLAGIPVRVGHPTDRRRALLTEAVAVIPGRHRSLGYVDVVARLGALSDVTPPTLALSDDDRRFGDRLVADLRWPADARPLFVNPAAAKTPRAWSADRFQRLVETYAERRTGQHVLVHERAPFQAPAEWTAHRAIGIVAGATLVQLAGVLERCALYVGNDSGPMHLAAALGVPTIGIYGSSSPGRTSPDPSAPARHVSVSANFPCAPCRERFFTECPSPPTPDGRPPCLDQVTTDMVVSEVDRLLETEDDD